VLVKAPTFAITIVLSKKMYLIVVARSSMLASKYGTSQEFSSKRS
jgi:hypothetical protein